MEPLITVSADLINTGFFPDIEPLTVPLWVDLNNVWPSDRGLKPLPGAGLLSTFSENITGLAQAYVDGAQRVYVGGQTKAWHYANGGQTLISDGLTSTTRTRVETFGTWALINNGVDRPRLWKNTGLALPMNTLPYNWVKHLNKFKTMILVSNTNTDSNILAWSGMDDPEQWAFSNPENTSGELFVRDLDGPIMAQCGLGEAIAAYSNETLIKISFLGNAFVIGATPTLKGIGVWGGESVCEHEGLNYGFGPQGIFKTDGNGFSLLDQDRVKDYISESIDLTRREETFCYRNELLNMIEFVYVDQDGARRRLGLSLSSGGFWPFDKELHRAIERQVFNVPIGSEGPDLLQLNTGTTWNGEAIDGYAQSKPISNEDPTRAMTLNMLQIDGKIGGASIKVEMMESPDAVSWTPVDSIATWRNWFNAEGILFKFRLSFSSVVTAIEVNTFKFFGILTGRSG